VGKRSWVEGKSGDQFARPSVPCCLLLVALFASSCVVPLSCIDQVYGPSARRYEHLVTLRTYSEPIEPPKRLVEPPKKLGQVGIGMWERFKYGATIRIDTGGRVNVSTDAAWPERCPDLSQEDLVEISRNWQPILDQMALRHTDLRLMANADVHKDDWRPDGPLLELSFGSTSPKGSTSTKTIGLLWDFWSSPPKDLYTAVMATLEVICSESRLARKYLLRDLPRPVFDQLECEVKRRPEERS
jgi:hypothetical protein